MKNVSHKKRCNTVTIQVNMELPPTPLIKIKNYEKLDKYFVKIKFCSDMTSEKLDLYEF